MLLCLFRYLLPLALLALGGAGAGAQDLPFGQRFASLMPTAIPDHLAEGRATSAPIGFVRFCAEHPYDCVPTGAAVSAIHLDSQSSAELERANNLVNKTVEPATDLDHYGETERWEYPDDGRGDCEDYVLAKRRMLLQRGWPASVLLITVVRDHNGDGHAVLVVVTDAGDLVLDNQDDRVLPWSETGYRFVKRQSQASPGHWVSLGDTGVPPVVGAGR